MISTILAATLLSVASQHAAHTPRPVPSIIETEHTIIISLSDCTQFSIESIVTNGEKNSVKNVTTKTLRKSKRQECSISLETTFLRRFTKIGIRLEMSSYDTLAPHALFIEKSEGVITQITGRDYECSQKNISCDNGLLFTGSENEL